MEKDLAENLDDLICAGSLNVDGSNYNVWYKIVGLLFVVWITVAGLVYLVANYLIQSPPSNSSTTEVNSDISTNISPSVITEQSNESEKVIHKEVRNSFICTKYLKFDFIKCLIHNVLMTKIGH